MTFNASTTTTLPDGKVYSRSFYLHAHADNKDEDDSETITFAPNITGVTFSNSTPLSVIIVDAGTVCEVLTDAPVNGGVSYDDAQYTDSVATYSCDSDRGYEISAATTRTCEAGDTGAPAVWSAADVPTCVDSQAPVFADSDLAISSGSSPRAVQVATPATSVFTINATDNSGVAPTYAKSADTGAFNADRELFSVHATTGALTFVAASVVRSAPYRVTVTATDGTNTATGYLSVTVGTSSQTFDYSFSSPAISLAERDAGAMIFNINVTSDMAIPAHSIDVTIDDTVNLEDIRINGGATAPAARTFSVDIPAVRGRRHCGFYRTRV